MTGKGELRGPLAGWLVLYSFGNGDLLPKHYKTQKMASKFAEEHRAIGAYAIVVNVEDLVAWVGSGIAELERIFRL